MAQAAKAPNNLLMPSPKELDRALTLSADRARRMAEAFGLKVPSTTTKPVKPKVSGAAQRRSSKA